MNKDIYVITVTYNTEEPMGGALKYDTYEEAWKVFNNLIDQELQRVKEVDGYFPAKLEWNDWEITLVYKKGFKYEPLSRDYALEDCVFYQLFRIKA